MFEFVCVFVCVCVCVCVCVLPIKGRVRGGGRCGFVWKERKVI